jgi:hypothetical protein
MWDCGICTDQLDFDLTSLIPDLHKLLFFFFPPPLIRASLIVAGINMG